MVPFVDTMLADLGLTPPKRDPLRCLVVDSDKAVRDALRKRLARRPATEVLEVTSGDEAVALVESDPAVNLVLMDCHTHERGAKPALEAMLAARHVPVIILAGCNDTRTVVNFLRAGAADAVQKPLVMDELLERVENALEKEQVRLERAFYQSRLAWHADELAERLRVQLVGSFETLAQAIEAKDPYTAGHSRRVSLYSGWIAERVAPAAKYSIVRGARLHDVGKIGVREAVLHKPGRLDESERSLIQLHPIVGERILRPIAYSDPTLLNIVRSHHERIDGLGFPDGLAGDEIPLEARIVAVADAFDAMTSRRPYRDGLSLDKATAELERCRGTQWQSELVEVFLEELGLRGMPEELDADSDLLCVTGDQPGVAASL